MTTIMTISLWFWNIRIREDRKRDNCPVCFTRDGSVKTSGLGLERYGFPPANHNIFSEGNLAFPLRLPNLSPWPHSTTEVYIEVIYFWSLKCTQRGDYRYFCASQFSLDSNNINGNLDRCNLASLPLGNWTILLNCMNLFCYSSSLMDLHLRRGQMMQRVAYLISDLTKNLRCTLMTTSFAVSRQLHSRNQGGCFLLVTMTSTAMFGILWRQSEQVYLYKGYLISNFACVSLKLSRYNQILTKVVGLRTNDKNSVYRNLYFYCAVLS